MTGSLRDLDVKISYDTFEDEPLTDFLVPALSQSVRYDRAVGFFSSALLSVIAEAFTDFTERGGKMRLVCSPIFSMGDVRNFENLESLDFESRLDEDIEFHSAKEELDDTLSLMAWMIRKGSLDIRIAIPRNGGGLFHQKIGTFTDSAGNKISFNGSNNETLSAWGTGLNSESFTTHASWQSQSDQKHVQNISEKFERFWEDEYPGYVFIPLAKSMKFLTARDAEDPKEVARIKEKVRAWVEQDKSSTKRLAAVKLRDYQENVLQSWQLNGYSGTVSFATGAGKTITALEGMSRWLNLGHDRSVVILVPSVRLQKQWLNEIKCFPGFEEANILLAGGGHAPSIWRMGLPGFTRALAGANSRIVLATIDTAKSGPFLSRMYTGNNVLVIADEMHNLGAKSYLPLLEKIELTAKLALTATPDRYDEEETAHLREVFGNDLEPVIDVREAQSLGVLVNYEYQISRVHLNEEESGLYHSLSKEIAQLTAIAKSKKGGQAKSSTRLNNLKIARARVIKNAQAKPGMAASILRRNYQFGQSWIVFCSDTKQLLSLKELIMDLKPYSYFQGMEGDPDKTLTEFSQSGGILLAIQMMDEGVDIPSIDHAILLASSQSSREFIQRRGRVLRRNPNKAKMARFWDVFVVDEDGFAVSQNELTRGRIFSEAAINPLIAFEVEEMMRPGSEEMPEDVII